jgi:hypothetical protein
MNTGHDGSMGTLHANSAARGPVASGIDDHHGRLLAAEQTIREMIVSSVDVIVQASRLRDGSRRITHITEVHRAWRATSSSPRTSSSTTSSGETPNGKIHRAAPLHRHRPARVSGTARAITARKTVSPRRLMPARLLKDNDRRRKSVQDQLREFETGKRSARTNRRVSASRSGSSRPGLTWTRRTFYIFSVVSGLVVTLIGFSITSSILVNAGFAFVGFFGIPRFYLGRKKK